MDQNSTSKLLRYGALILCLIAIIAIVVFSSLNKKSPEAILEEQKQEVLAVVASDAKLSEEEKMDLFRKVSGENLKKFTFTEEEKQMLLKKLNE